MPSTPPTSPQRHQEAARQAERSNRIMASPEQRRTPAGPSTSAAPPPPITQASSGGPITFGQQTRSYLPSNLVSMLQNLPPMPPAPKRGRPSAPLLGAPSVSLTFILNV